ncbi:hypothetical protein GCM10029992_45270 [Glycomyces albus]
MDKSPQAPQRKVRPGAVTFAVALQWLLALVLLASAAVGFIYGPDAQEAFEDALAEQGFAPEDLPEGFASFDSSANLIFPVVVAVIMVVLALLNARGTGRAASSPGSSSRWC